MIAIGIDPGLTGALAVINRLARTATVHDLPLTGEGAKRRIDGRALILLLRQVAPAADAVVVGLEEVHALPGFGIKSQEAMCGAAYSVQAVLDIFRAPVTLVLPKVWKKQYLLAKKRGEKPTAWKARHVDVARRLYPACAGLERAKDHNRAEALLIAHHIALEVAG